MKHVKKFNEFLADENPNSDPNRTADTKAPETPNVDSPEKDTADEPTPEPEKEAPSEAPATEVADDTQKEAEDEAGVSEGNAFSGAVAKAKKEGKTEFEFKGKTFQVKEKASVTEGNAFSGAVAKAKKEGKTEFEFEGKTYQIKENEGKTIMGFGDFIAENFALYPSYNNMVGSNVIRDIPITHQVNMSVYGKENVVDGYGATPVAVEVTVKEGEEPMAKCCECGNMVPMTEIEQLPMKECSECASTKWEAAK